MMKVRIGKDVVDVKDMRGVRSLIGLMFDSSSEGALISGNSVWMPFVPTGLHLFFLSNDWRILKYEYAMPLTINPATWKVYSCKKAKYCLELRKMPKRWKIGERVVLRIKV